MKDGLLLEVPPSGLMCLTCGATKACSFRRMVCHLESLHGFGGGYPCPFCERVPRTEDSRRKHVLRRHRQVKSLGELREMPPYKIKTA